MTRAALLLLAAAAAGRAEIPIVALPASSPLVDFRIVFLTGAAYDPTGKAGTAHLTASLLAGGGTRDLTYPQIVDTLFPAGASVSAQTDKEMIVFHGSTHIDNLEKYYGLVRAMILEPGWRDDDFRRVRDDAVNFLRVTLRANNDEELAKEALYETIYRGRPYGRHNAGSAASLQSLTVGDLRRFYQAQFTQANLVLGIAGGFPAAFPARMRKDFASLPEGAPVPRSLPPPVAVSGMTALLIEKETRSVAFSLGFPIAVQRGDPDFPALLVAQSYLGQHRSSAGRLFDRIREVRGLNYGDYAYIEYFPRGMFRFEPEPNLVRR
ncbi:MAG: M16 family metallopeptidase, partial [Bryobacteraceae bacterium]